jgi:hypothetical protein
MVADVVGAVVDVLWVWCGWWWGDGGYGGCGGAVVVAMDVWDRWNAREDERMKMLTKRQVVGLATSPG